MGVWRFLHGSTVLGAALWASTALAAASAAHPPQWKLDGPFATPEKYCKTRLNADARLPTKDAGPVDRTVCPSGPGPIATIENSETWPAPVREVRPLFVHLDRAIGTSLDCVRLSVRTKSGWLMQKDAACLGDTGPSSGIESLAVQRIESVGAGLVALRYTERAWVKGSDEAPPAFDPNTADGGPVTPPTRVDSTARVARTMLVVCDPTVPKPTCIGPLPIGYALPSGKNYDLDVQFVGNEVRVSGTPSEQAEFDDALSTPPSAFTWASVVGVHAVSPRKAKPPPRRKK